MFQFHQKLRHRADDDSRSADRYREIAQRHRLSADAAMLPRVKEQMMRSAEKWEFLANSYDSTLELAV